MLSEIDQTRLRVSAGLNPENKALLGQYLTPSSIADFMASLFSSNGFQHGHVLDPGAGIGSLSAAFLDRWESGHFDFQSLELTTCEIDDSLQEYLTQTILAYNVKKPFRHQLLLGDFIQQAVHWISFSPDKAFTHAIINPPYKKLSSQSLHRFLLRQTGIETVNLYSAFIALALLLLVPGGQLVAIVPRSFCNGLYYRPFRNFILKQSAIRHLHLFHTRNKAFQDDGVLQENIILMLEKNGRQEQVNVSTSTDGHFNDYAVFSHPFEKIVLPNDTEQFIHIPTSVEINPLEQLSEIRYSLQDIGVQVSTGPVVDFRVREHLCDTLEPDCVPLLYPSHFLGWGLEYPKPNFKKPNAIRQNNITEKLLYPIGFYTVVKRFSAKEEKKRIMASVIDPKAFMDSRALGFENHLNVFHQGKQGLPEALAWGLTVFLSTTAIDLQFRGFNGHTQVNATDLKQLKFPSRKALMVLGEWAMAQNAITQTMIDQQLETITT